MTLCKRQNYANTKNTNKNISDCCRGWEKGLEVGKDEQAEQKELLGQ